MKKIGFFGGCFNPVTKAHVDLAKQAIAENGLDEVYFVPMNDYYNKANLIGSKDRVNMLKLAIQDEPQIKIDDVLLNINKPTTAIDSFELLTKLNPTSDNYFLMGSDNYSKIGNWKGSEKLLKDYKYIVFDRSKNNISSTKVRQNLDDNSINTMLDSNVKKYIKDNNLYNT